MSFRHLRNRRPLLAFASRFTVVVMLGLVAVVVLAGSSAAGLTNTAQLDNGVCGRNLQLGSEKTASSSATPSFLIAGDGGLSSYRAFVDGAQVGTFFSDGFANVCVYTSVPLADGPHVLTANELLPHPTYTIVPFSFTVDTAPPAQPSTPVISGYSDSGFAGDHITMYRNVNFTGFADPNVSIQLFSGPSLLGGAQANGAGFWSATTSTLADGNYTFTAAALDQAGNKSMLSLSCPLTIDGTAPTGALTSPLANSTVNGTVQFAAAASDQVGIWKVDYKVDGTIKGTVTGPPPYNYSWNSLQVADGSHTVTALITDFAGNTLSSTVTVNVQNSGANPTAPSAPTLNSATAGNASVTLNWSAPTSDGGSALTAYRVYRSNTSGAETLLTTLGTATSFTDTSLTNGSTYYYKVSAVNSVGESALSSERSAIPASTPNAPTLNTPTAGNTMVTFTWTTPNGNGSTVTGYRVYRSTSSGTETLYTTIGALNAFTDTGLTNGTTYYYKLTALNAVGESGLSNERFGTPATTPGAPTLGSATAGTASVTLSWSAPGSNGGSSLTGYRVYRSTSSGSETLLTTLGLVTGYTDTAVSNGTTYFYKVSALNALGESALSNERFATPTAAPTAPDAPALNAPTAGNGTVGLTWTTPSSNGSALTGYRVYRSTTSGAETLLVTLGLVNGYTDTAVSNGTTYYYKVTALNAVGESSLSSERSATPATTPSAPTLNPATSGNGTVGLSWTTPSGNGSTLTGYRVYRSTSSGTQTALTTLGLVNGYTDTSVTNGTTYFYEVTALNALGESGLSNERSAAPAGAPSAPVLNAATAGNGSVSLSWTTPSPNGSAILGYWLYRSTTSGAETLLGTLGTVNSYTDTGLTNGTTYYYKITALNAVGESSFSNERFATPATTPSAPTLNLPTAGNGSVGLSWTTPSGNGSALTGYRVYRSTTSGAETLLSTLGVVNAYTDTAVSNGTTYYYKVTALNAVGESSLSSERSATPATPATSPSAPTLNTATAGNATVSLSWTTPSANGSAILGYWLYRSTASGAETLLGMLGTVNSYTDVGLVNGITYYYKISAVNAYGESSLSNERSATPGAPASIPAAPRLDSATPGASTVTLSWSAPTSDGGSAVTGYRLYRSTTSGNETLLATVGPATGYTDTAVSNGTTYYYVVSAVNGVGEGASSNELSALPVTTPDAPSLTAAVPGSDVTLTWDAPASNGGSPIAGYRVYRSTTSGTGTLLATVGAVTSYTDEGPTLGWTYYYQVTAFSSVGESDPSNEMWATPMAEDTTAPAKPGNLKALLSGTSQIALDWVDSTDNTGISWYRVFRDGTLLATVQDSRYLDSGLAPGSNHVYQVRAVDGSGNASLPSSNLNARVGSVSTGATGTLAGVVHNQAGKVVTNAIVTLMLGNGTLKSAKTNSSGVWKLSSLPAGPYALTVSLTGYQPASLSMTAVAGQTLLALVTLAPAG